MGNKACCRKKVRHLARNAASCELSWLTVAILQKVSVKSVKSLCCALCSMLAFLAHTIATAARGRCTIFKNISAACSRLIAFALQDTSNRAFKHQDSFMSVPAEENFIQGTHITVRCHPPHVSQTKSSCKPRRCCFAQSCLPAALRQHFIFTVIIQQHPVYIGSCVEYADAALSLASSACVCCLQQHAPLFSALLHLLATAATLLPRVFCQLDSR